jgi:hypothetical protein
MPDKPNRLYYVGDRDIQGRPFEYYEGVPARDLEPEDVALLDDATVKMITSDRPGGAKALYQRSEPSGRRAGDEPEGDGAGHQGQPQAVAPPAGATTPARGEAKKG